MLQQFQLGWDLELSLSKMNLLPLALDTKASARAAFYRLLYLEQACTSFAQDKPHITPLQPLFMFYNSLFHKIYKYIFL
jgi:hypothetical protein